MKRSTIQIIAFSLWFFTCAMTYVLLVYGKHHGLHPNMNAFAVIMIVSALFTGAQSVNATSKHTSK